MIWSYAGSLQYFSYFSDLQNVSWIKKVLFWHLSLLTHTVDTVSNVLINPDLLLVLLTVGLFNFKNLSKLFFRFYSGHLSSQVKILSATFVYPMAFTTSFVVVDPTAPITTVFCSFHFHRLHCRPPWCFTIHSAAGKTSPEPSLLSLACFGLRFSTPGQKWIMV